MNSKGIPLDYSISFARTVVLFISVKARLIRVSYLLAIDISASAAGVDVLEMLITRGLELFPTTCGFSHQWN